MVDWGLIGGLAQGLDSGFKSYRDTQKAQQEALQQKIKQEREDKMFQAEIQSKGYLQEKQHQFDMERQREQLGAMERIARIRNRDKETQEKSPGEAFKDLPKESQIEIEDITKKNIGLKQGRVALKSYIDQLKDEGRTEEEKLRIARQSVKLLNELSSSGATSDAVGAEEVQRLAAELERWAPKQRGLLSFGRDLPGYTSGLEDLDSRLSARVEGNLGLLNKAHGNQKYVVGEVYTKNGKQYEFTGKGFKEINSQAARK